MKNAWSLAHPCSHKPPGRRLARTLNLRLAGTGLSPPSNRNHPGRLVASTIIPQACSNLTLHMLPTIKPGVTIAPVDEQNHMSRTSTPIDVGQLSSVVNACLTAVASERSARRTSSHPKLSMVTHEANIRPWNLGRCVAICSFGADAVQLEFPSWGTKLTASLIHAHVDPTVSPRKGMLKAWVLTHSLTNSTR